jgi:WD40-like Beta Propeller Repeat
LKIVWLVALAGCDSIFGLNDVKRLPDSDESNKTPWACTLPDFSTWTAEVFLIGGNAFDTVDHPTIDIDRNRLLFAAHSDIWGADIVQPGMAGAINAARVDTLSVMMHTESAPSVWPDGLRIFVEEDNKSILQSAVGTVDWKVGVPLAIPSNVGAVEIGTPAQTVDHGDRIVVASLDPPIDLHEYEFNDTAWVEHHTLEAVNSPLDDRDPYLSVDGCWVVFSSNRVTSGNYDLYVAMRGTDGNFAPATVMPFSVPGLDDEAPTSTRFMDQIIFQRGSGLARAHP